MDLRTQLENEIIEIKKLDSDLSPERVQGRVRELDQLMQARILEIQQKYSGKELDDKVIGLIEKKQRSVLSFLEGELEKFRQEVQARASDVKEIVQELEVARDSMQKLVKENESQLETFRGKAEKSLQEKISEAQEEIDEKIDARVKEKHDEIMHQVQQDFPQLSQALEDMKGKRVELDKMLDSTRSTLDEYTKTLEDKVSHVDAIVNVKMDTLVSSKTKEFDTKLSQNMDEISHTKRELGQKLLEAQSLMQNLNVFKDQFLSTVKQANLDKQDDARVFHQKLDEFSAKSDVKIQEMDTRLRQMDEVVASLATVLDELRAAQANATGAVPESKLPPNSKSVKK